MSSDQKASEEDILRENVKKERDYRRKRCLDFDKFINAIDSLQTCIQLLEALGKVEELTHLNEIYVRLLRSPVIP